MTSHRTTTGYTSNVRTQNITERPCLTRVSENFTESGLTVVIWGYLGRVLGGVITHVTSESPKITELHRWVSPKGPERDTGLSQQATRESIRAVANLSFEHRSAVTSFAEHAFLATTTSSYQPGGASGWTGELESGSKFLSVVSANILFLNFERWWGLIETDQCHAQSGTVTSLR
ncbi:hypothetical protein I7I51_02888 [Histoplasma capsulatum]|uniref:Uncharacterized protein n=1 Tax=Ajellomyces capsulatus TaxID=5037 RepID=A0A8A1MLH1_AJECA|nr:predicted protein [Histoplasma mississippiense (nom. inval.)]EDN11408.1 predicted protein [Histoplasma mississippiense (nom. inval.)]QSS66679.1 hypothetical protein I7I51_02888 [Histoplasma capsulatum]